ncbi:MAG: 2-isopropylmalate synthase [Desulfobacterales bacterium CG07_land_8_20_14_0_80_52_14]|nr:MAG: 2-isopropylmalate synthase [Desulfobacterales bacterium CG23_combo_of_CG06-09_8_20_14_all_52_9]PIU50613.1 MAG: 2-isopropylmalate synthase [Desulfobacterales bacterium CG07_land_8_20_14_0_80_52_14]
MIERVFIFDTTLRDGEQSPGASMNTAEKLRLATQLEKLGVDIIEAGFPAASEGDFEAVSEISKRIKNAEVAGLARTSKNDIDRVWGAVRHAAKPKIHTFIATSDIHLAHKLKMSREQVMSAAVEAVRYSKTLTENVEFSAEDGSRSDRDFLCRIFEAVIEAGATVVNLPDTVGYAIPEEFARLVEYVRSHVPNIGKAVLSIHCHNDLGLATSNTLAALSAGARQAEVTINGIGERAGNTSLEEVVMALHTRPNFFPLTTGIRTEQIYPTSRLTSMITGIIVQPNKAIVGANAFAHEAGIHQDGVLKNPMTYEIMKPETVGLSTNRLVLGKHSGRHALRNRLKDMGYDLSDEELRLVFTRFKELADKKKHVVDEDLEIIVTEGILRTADIFNLEYLHVTCGTTVLPMASVQLTVNGRMVRGAAYGNGPIDAAFESISKLTGTAAELLRFSVSAITGGTDALGEVTVRLGENGLIALGKGADPDIITASAKAFVNGLNRLEYLKRHPVDRSEAL